VFLASLNGGLSTPMTEAYDASKVALEDLADALRMEFRPWGIRVVLIEPAQSDTGMWRRADDELEKSVAGAPTVHPRALRPRARGA
jgi:NAD(P)-dependent dehydrogenase (short-subunit alcohol dehydrogenase family)